MKKVFTKVRGFTLIELLVAIGIIAILVSITFASMSEARKNSRDKKRIADLGQIQLALKLYQVQNDFYPRESDGFSGTGGPGRICATCNGPINDVIRQYMGSLPVDPLDTGNYYYYYDGSQYCEDNPGQAVLSARTMETDTYKNYEDTICTSWGGESGIGNADSHNVVLGPSSG